MCVLCFVCACMLINFTLNLSYAPEDLSVCQRDLVDLIVLYCSRRETEYHHILSQVIQIHINIYYIYLFNIFNVFLCIIYFSSHRTTLYHTMDMEPYSILLYSILFYSTQILGPILVSPHRMPRGLAYSCFYSLCSKFIPLINLQDTAFTKAISKLSEWIRLLTIYHFPALAIHLVSFHFIYLFIFF